MESRCILNGREEAESKLEYEEEQVGYPRFVSADCAAWFFHWMTYKFQDCPTGTTCNICDCVKQNIDFATCLLIEAIYNMHHDFTAGSNIVSINMGYITQAKAREILDTTPLCLGLTRAEEDGVMKKRVADSLAKDFPGLQGVEGLTRYAGVYTPVMGKGGNSLYHTLSILYKASKGLPRGNWKMKNISVTEFCLLCFHLNQQYYLTANSTCDLWSGALKINSIATLLSECPLNYSVYKSLWML